MRPKLITDGRRIMSPDPNKMRSALSAPPKMSSSFATVGHVADELIGLPEPTPSFARLEQGQVFVEVTIQPEGDQVIARLGMPAAGVGAGWYMNLSFGCRVLLEYPRDNPTNATIVARLHDQECSFPTDVAGVQTGAAVAVAPKVGVPAPMWQFMKTAAGELLAIETGPLGDILIHSGGSVEIKAAPAIGAIHLNGRVAMGEGTLTPPVGATVGPAGVTIPGIPAVPSIPIPAVPNIPAPPKTIVPYIGLRDGVVRSKDRMQSHAAVDPDFWLWVTAVHAHPVILALLSAAGITPPLAVHSEHSGLGGPGSQHTASD